MDRIAVRLTYDVEADAAYVYLVASIGSGEVEETRHCLVELDRAAINLDFDIDGRLLGIEILGASRVLRPEVLMSE